jgi:hypothetical protein
MTDVLLDEVFIDTTEGTACPERVKVMAPDGYTVVCVTRRELPEFLEMLSRVKVSGFQGWSKCEKW